MRNVSLKWLIFSFYVAFGYLPAILLSYFSIDAFSRTVSSATEEHMTDVVRQAAAGIETFCSMAGKDLASLSFELAYPLSFPETEEKAVREKLDGFVGEGGRFDRIFLQGKDCFFQAGKPVFQPDTDFFNRDRPDGPERVRFIADREGVPGGTIQFLRKVRDVRDGVTVVGTIVAEVALETVLDLLRDARTEEGIEKSIVTSLGEPICLIEATNKPTQGILQKTRVYSAGVPRLQWQIVFRVPEELLFRDVNRIVFNNLTSIALVALLAVGVAFEFSRRATKPLTEIIAGTREFASGRLHHRIDVRYGKETRQLADAFNAMAAHLSENHEKLVQANKLSSLGLLAAGIAHEIKNPLAGIKTSAQVLDRLVDDGNAKLRESTLEEGSFPKSEGVGAGDPMRVRKLSLGIVKEADRLNRIVEDMLTLARPRSAESVPTDISEIVHRALEILQNELKKKGVSVTNKVETRIVYVDPDQMLQVFVNLVLNAIAAVDHDRGHIRLTSESTGTGEPVVLVKDNGRGIPEAKLEQVFDPFFSLTKGGTGLGLSVAHSLLRQNDVQVGISSREGDGTLISLTFGRSGGEGPEERIRG